MMSLKTIIKKLLTGTVCFSPQPDRPLDIHSDWTPVRRYEKPDYLQMALAPAENVSCYRRHVRILLWPVANAAGGCPHARLYGTANDDCALCANARRACRVAPLDRCKRGICWRSINPAAWWRRHLCRCDRSSVRSILLRMHGHYGAPLVDDRE